MSVHCCIKFYHIPATIAVVHTPYVITVDLHTLRQHLENAHFNFLISGTLFRMISGASNTVIIYISLEGVLTSFRLDRLIFLIDDNAYMPVLYVLFTFCMRFLIKQIIL